MHKCQGCTIEAVTTQDKNGDHFCSVCLAEYFIKCGGCGEYVHVDETTHNNCMECTDKKIILTVEGGSVFVKHNPSKLPIIVRDYDIDGMDEDEYDIKTDDGGNRYTEVEAEQ